MTKKRKIKRKILLSTVIFLISGIGVVTAIEYISDQPAQSTGNVAQSAPVAPQPIADVPSVPIIPNTTGIPILMYHFFYDSRLGQTGADSNYTDAVEFEEQVKYLADNGYYTPTWSELGDYIDGTKVLPEKSIMLTFDDGSSTFFDIAYPVLVKYQIHATSFIVTSWTDPKNLTVDLNLISFQSHSNDMHQGGCTGGHGGLFQCIDHQLGLNDLNASKQVTGSSDVFCYPFGDYNDSEKQLLREAGFKIAVTTEYGKAQIGIDKLQLPRIRMNGGTSLDGFIGAIN